jgi:Short C-terminal domain/Phospholipase_D-nuclease N-terminal
VLAAEFGTGQVFLSIMWFFLFITWFWLLITVCSDLFRSQDLSGWAKAAWAVFVVFLPYLGVFAYLAVRGHKMGQHALEDSQRQEEAFRAAVRSAATPTAGDQLEQLAALRQQGVIDDDEFQRMKARVAVA